MSHAEHKNTLETFAQNHKYVRIELTSGASARGKIVHAGDFGAILAIVEDFHFDGFGMISLESIEAVHNDEDEIFTAEILSKESISEPSLPSLDFSSLETLLDGLAGSFVMLEDGEYDLHFARLDGITDGEVTLTPFSSTGQFEPSFSQAIADIYTIRFENEYLKMYQKYAK
ncbi:MAG: hypothetical protein ACOYN2_01780 [Patescibacteria group bacterium]